MTNDLQISVVLPRMNSLTVLSCSGGPNGQVGNKVARENFCSLRKNQVGDQEQQAGDKPLTGKSDGTGSLDFPNSHDLNEVLNSCQETGPVPS